MKQMVYIVTRLFNKNDREVSLKLNNIINNWIKEKKISEWEMCFLPYRDSNDKVKGKENQTFEIFRMDCETIRKSSLLVGYCDGPVYDSGIGFEVGYAATLNIPIILLTTDYFFVNIANMNYSISPLTSRVSQIIHAREVSGKVNGYQESLDNIESQVLERLLKTMNTLKRDENWINVIEPIMTDVYIDSAFLATESSAYILHEIVEFLETQQITYYVATETETEINIAHLKKCQIAVLYGDEFDMNIDSAITQGIAYGWKKRILLYSSSRNYYFQSSNFILYKNPMIEHSANVISKSINELVRNLTLGGGLCL